jgi:GNAT superfamily N-acetyltransferase
MMPATQLSQSSQLGYTISSVQTPADIEAIRSLLNTYSHGQIEKQIMALAAEGASLPGRFSPPHGELFLAHMSFPDCKPIGWVGLRPFPELSGPQAAIRDTDVYEAKRLFVLEEYRGLGIGRALV